ncbi:MAG: tetratricopeptide repeat protein [Aulosira sp. DedQUE10]|nr:tetratricopeptide repeat protein [Aulosira sp. DedQUE10]
MFSREFLLQIATTYGLTQEQKEVFVQRLLEGKSHAEIAKALEISKEACLRRMAEVYKKFGTGGKGRSKDGELRKFLAERLKQYNVSPSLDAELTERVDDLSSRVFAIERAKSQKSDVSPTIALKLSDSYSIPSRDFSYTSPFHNLPARSNEFIGRKEELTRLLKYLFEDHASPIITVDGIGGVGKTALVLEAAYRCLAAKDSRKSSKTPNFDTIIFVSAKENDLLPIGIVERLEAQKMQTLADIYKAIAFTLDERWITQYLDENHLERVKQIFKLHRTLLIVDNFETLSAEESHKVLGFLKCLPREVKSIITTREQKTIDVDIRLDNLPEEDSLTLIRQQIQEKALTLTEQDIQKLAISCRGVPLVIVYAVGRLANSITLDTVLEDLQSATSDLAHFLFKKSVEELKGKPAYKVLMSLAIFRKAPLYNALIEVAGLQTEPPSVARSALERLQQLSLVRQQDGRYKILPLTREYAYAELKDNLDFEKEAREVWFNWYLNFAKEHGGDDWGEWHNQYDWIDEEWENFLALLDWCSSQKQHSKVKELWQFLNKCANLYGHWVDRENWLTWLIESSQRRGDWGHFVQVTTALSWTLILRESPQNLAKADKLLQEAWKLREQTKLSVQYVLAENIAVLRIRQEKFEEAREWFDVYKKLITEAALDDKEKQRSEIRFQYYNAEILYRKKKYNEAKILYQHVVEKAEEIDWRRFVANSQNWLATIAIKQNELNEAERLLSICLPVAERNKDQRRTACCQYTRARLEKVRGNIEKAIEWAKKALDRFERLGIERDAEEARSFLTELELGASVTSSS